MEMPFCRARGMQRHSSSGTEGNVNLQGLKSQSPCPSHSLATVASPQWKILGEDAQRKVHGKAFQTPSAWRLKGGNWENASLTCLTGMFCHTEHHLFLKMTENSFGDPRCRVELIQEFGDFPVYLFYQGSIACAEVLHPPFNSVHRGPVLIAPESLQNVSERRIWIHMGKGEGYLLQFLLACRECRHSRHKPAWASLSTSKCYWKFSYILWWRKEKADSLQWQHHPQSKKIPLIFHTS